MNNSDFYWTFLDEMEIMMNFETESMAILN